MYIEKWDLYAPIKLYNIFFFHKYGVQRLSRIPFCFQQQSSALSLSISLSQYIAEVLISPLRIATSLSEQVDIASDCARLQHRLSLPPLEVEDFPRLDLADSKILHSGRLQENTNGVDIFQEILSVNSASQQLTNNSIYPDIWAGTNSHFDEFSCLLEFEVDRKTEGMHFSQMDGMGSSRSMTKSCEVEDPKKLIEICDLEEKFKNEKENENLTGVKILNNELIEV